MSRVVRSCTLVILTLLLLTTATKNVRTQSSQYQVLDLGTLGGAQSAAYAIGEYGYDVVGTAQTSSPGASHAFVNYYQDPKQMFDLGTLGGQNSTATAISGGYIAGYAQTASGAYHAVRWSDGPVDLGTLGGAASWAYGLNQAGTVVGTALPATGNRRAFIYQNGAMSEVTLGSISESQANDINNSGQVVGWLKAAPGSPARAFLWQNGVRTDIGALVSGGSSVANAINESGVVVGEADIDTTGGGRRAFRWQNGSLQALPTLEGRQASARAINDEGVIVGWSETSTAMHAVIWRNGQIADLNDLIDPRSGWVLRAAHGINPDGAIVGEGAHNGVPRAFFLKPPLDLVLSFGPHFNELETNYPDPHPAGDLIPLGVSISHSDGMFLATGVEVTATIGGPFAFTYWDAGCTPSGQTITCSVPRFEEGWGRTVVYGVRATGPGQLTHHAYISASDTHDPNTSNNSATETNTAVSLAALSLSQNTVTGGQRVLARATLTSGLPQGLYAEFTSTRPDVVAVPQNFAVFGLYREFYLSTNPVTSPVTVEITATGGLRTVKQTLTVMPAGVPFPYGGTSHAVPGIIQAEDYDGGGQNVGYFDTTVNNEGDAYRDDDVDIQATSDGGGGYNVGWTSRGEWLQYTVNVASAGTYRLDLRVAANGAGGRLHLESNGVDKSGPIIIPNTGGWQAWQTVSAPVTLAPGLQRLRLVIDAAGPTGIVGNINRLQFTATSTAPSSTPYSGPAVSLPGIVQAENFDNGGANVAYRDTTTANSGGAYRPQEQVDIQATTDSGGGHNVGWMAATEWLNYSVNVQTAGTYRLDLRVAANGAGGRLHVEFNGVDKTGAMNIPNTGGWQTWTTISAPVTLSAGPQYMRVVVDAAGPTGVVGNLNFIQVVSTTAPPPPQDIVIYASDLPTSARHGNWSQGADAASPGGVKLQTPDLAYANASSPLAAPVHYIDVTFTATANTPYTLWLRLKALNNSKYNDAVWVQFSGAIANGRPVFAINTTAGLLVNLATDSNATSLNNWGWVNGAYWLTQPTTFTFPAGGTQTMRIQVREDGVQLDQIVLSPKAYLSSPPGGPTNDATIVAKP
jgi:probable HAF family extracellular repeat protein